MASSFPSVGLQQRKNRLTDWFRKFWALIDNGYYVVNGWLGVYVLCTLFAKILVFLGFWKCTRVVFLDFCLCPETRAPCGL